MSFTSDIPGLQNQLPVSIQFPENPTEFRYQLNDTYQKIAATVNSKEGALYVPIEKITGGQYFTDDPFNNDVVYRMTVDFGALPNSGTKSVAHNIDWNSDYRLRRAYGGSTDPVAEEGLPIPNDGIFLKNNSTNVIVTTTANFSSFTETTIVLEYTKEG
jgi:hypothetical protein